MAYKPIRDYAIIGNLRSAALVGKDGSIDWAPAPYIDSPSVFAALLDDERGGYWQIKLAGDPSCHQYYLEDTNVLVTEFTGEDGAQLSVTDFMPIEEERAYLPPEEETTFKIKRQVACMKGTCQVEMTFMPRFDYARGHTALSYTDRGILVENDAMRGVLVMHHEAQIDNEAGVARAAFSLGEGGRDYVVFRFNTGRVDIMKDDNEHHSEELDEVAGLWREWSERCELPTCRPLGPHRDLIMRSALVLKILFFEPVGTVAAAATTSLPEWIGGVRNWDYRFTWLRDSAFVFNALFQLGHTAEAKEYLSWLTGICAMSHPEDVRIMYGLRGERELEEYILSHLEGYEGSMPVRIGNGAYLQRQWDIYGSFLDMAWQLHELSPDEGPIDEHTWSVLRRLAEYVCDIWEQPDEGLWEVRGGADHFTYSKVMCWVALDRAVKIAEAYEYEGDRARWKTERDRIREVVLTRGFNDKLGAFTQSFDSDDLDAAVLLLPRVGFIEGDDPRMRSTIARIKADLRSDENLLRRYSSPDGLPGEEGAFLLASFWLVDALVLAGELEEAEALLDHLIGLSNHVGLYAEEVDPTSGAFLGNFPQAYTHVGLINSALLLEDVKGGAGKK